MITCGDCIEFAECTGAPNAGSAVCDMYTSEKYDGPADKYEPPQFDAVADLQVQIDSLSAQVQDLESQFFNIIAAIVKAAGEETR